jgi:hypothetical protein
MVRLAMDSVRVATAREAARAMDSVRVATAREAARGMDSVRVATGARVRRGMVSVRVVTGARVRRKMVSVPAAIAVLGLPVMVRRRRGVASGRVDTVGGRAIAAATGSVTVSATRAVTVRDHPVAEEDVTRSCGPARASRLEAIGTLATRSVNSPRKSGWRASCDRFGRATTIRNCPMVSNPVTSTRVHVSN